MHKCYLCNNKTHGVQFCDKTKNRTPGSGGSAAAGGNQGGQYKGGQGATSTAAGTRAAAAGLRGGSEARGNVLLEAVQCALIGTQPQLQLSPGQARRPAAQHVTSGKSARSEKGKRVAIGARSCHWHVPVRRWER